MRLDRGTLIARSHDEVVLTLGRLRNIVKSSTDENRLREPRTGIAQIRCRVCGSRFWVLFEDVLCGDAVLINGLFDSGVTACPCGLKRELCGIAQIVGRTKPRIQSG